MEIYSGNCSFGALSYRETVHPGTVSLGKIHREYVCWGNVR